jgi:hypothetical protein
MYRSKAFRVRNLDETLVDIAEAGKSFGPNVRKVFVADGDALVLSLEQWEAILAACHEAFPQMERVSAYATAMNVNEKSREEFRRLGGISTRVRRRFLTTVNCGLWGSAFTALFLLLQHPNCAELALYVDFLKSPEWPFIVPISPSRHRANLAAVLVAEEVASEGRFPSSYPYAAITASIGTPKSTGQRCA